MQYRFPQQGPKAKIFFSSISIPSVSFSRDIKSCHPHPAVFLFFLLTKWITSYEEFPGRETSSSRKFPTVWEEEEKENRFGLAGKKKKNSNRIYSPRISNSGTPGERERETQIRRRRRRRQVKVRNNSSV